MLGAIKRYFAKKRAERELDQLVKTKSIPEKGYFLGLDLTRQVDATTLESLIKKLISAHYTEPEQVYSRYWEICKMDSSLQKQAFHELHMSHSKDPINQAAVIQIHEIRDVIYSLIKHADMCYWVDVKCKKCGKPVIKMKLNTPDFCWQQRYGWRCSMYICPECLIKWQAGGGFMIN